MDLWPFDVRRFATQQANRRYLAERSSEAYGSYYAVHWPAEEMESARGARRSPLHRTLFDHGAVYGSKAGWERPLWFDTGAVPAREEPSFVDKPGWFEAVGLEHKAVRERVGLIDQTSFSKFEIEGSGAAAACGSHRRQSHRSPHRKLRLHAALQREGRHRGRPHHHASRPRSLLCRDRQCLRGPRRRMDPPSSPSRRQRGNPRGDVGIRRYQPRWSQGPRRARSGDAG